VDTASHQASAVPEMGWAPLATIKDDVGILTNMFNCVYGDPHYALSGKEGELAAGPAGQALAPPPGCWHGRR
jgi:hypothetical protein